MASEEIDPRNIELIVAWNEFKDTCDNLGVDYRASVHLFTDKGDKLLVASSEPLRSSRAATVDLLDNGDVRILEHSYDCIGHIGKGNANIWNNMALSNVIEGGSEHIERYYEEVVDLIISCSKDKK
jgi:hypothetical protein